MKKKIQCKICGSRFEPKKENKYLVMESIGTFEHLTKAPKIYECFDCSVCGCQNIVNIRESGVQND